MKIGASADWHIEVGYDDDLKHSVMQEVVIFRNAGVDLITLPGDLFDHKSTPDGRNLLRYLIQQLSEVAPVIICYGNHDQPGDLDIFHHLNTIYPIHVISSPQRMVIDDIILHILPWFNKALWQAQNLGLSKEEGDRTVSQMALSYLKNSIILANSETPGKKHILMSHLTIEGSRAQNHQPLIGEGITFGKVDLIEAGFTAGIFGHIHLQQVFDEKGLFFYPGSPVAMNYGEEPDKYCVVLDTESEKVEWHKLETVDRFSIELSWQHDRPNSVFADITGVCSRIRGARVRALLSIDEGEDVAHAKAETERMLNVAGALEVKIDPQVKPKDLVRSIEISKAESISEKLDAYWMANNNRPDESTVAGMKAKLGIIENRSRG